MTFLGNGTPVKVNTKEFGAGTHGGKLSADARARRSAKNARNRNRSHPRHPLHQHDMIEPGSNKKVHTRLFTRGNRLSRGIN